MILKTNFHLHTSNDLRHKISYTTYDAIDCAEKLNFDVLAVTCHQIVVDKKEYKNYADKKNILLIPGIEARIEGKHVVILNCDKSAEELKNFEGLKNYKKNHPQIFIIAPHPFVTDPSRVSLKGKLEENIELFDAIELTVFSNNFFNFNKKAKAMAKKYQKPLIANSDAHNLNCIEKGYALIEAENKNIESIFQAIKNFQVKNHLKPPSTWAMGKYRIKSLLKQLIL